MAREAKSLAGEATNRSYEPEGEKPSREKESLLLARTRILKDLQTTDNERYRAFLESSLSAIDKQLQTMK